MPSWPEIQEYARSKYNLNHDTPGAFSLVFEFSNKRTQQISVHHFTAFDKDWVEFRSFICKEADMQPKVALRKNAGFAIGAIAMDDEGDYYVIYSLPLGTMDPEEFELPLHVLAHTADKLEQEFTAKDDF